MNISNNVSSIQINQTFLNNTADNISSKKSNLAKDIPNLIVAEKINAININAIKTQNEMLGSLLDIKA